MLFNSFAFLAFFSIITPLYFALPHRWRWALMLAGSCVFYMFFVPVYVLILIATILIDYVAGLEIERSRTTGRRKFFLLTSILSVCGVLLFFKYHDFAAGNLARLAHMLGWNYSLRALNILLPIGLSFHTFQSLSYVIEVYRGKQKAEHHLGYYALYVMYYPQLVAGPIERPQNLLPQFHAHHSLSLARLHDGLLLALWGLFKKVVVADSAAIYVDAVYGSYRSQSGWALWIATYVFAFQIYADFSGYSDIARGVSRIYGIELMQNFRSPYFARSISEFWRRWHISLSTWFRDYLYVPLGGSRVSELRVWRNLLVVFGVSGLWHGANWTFVVWGLLHGLYLIVERAAGGARKIVAPGGFGPGALLRTFVVFQLVSLAWVFFRAESLSSAGEILGRIATAEPATVALHLTNLAQALMAITALLLVEAGNEARGWLERPALLRPPARLAMTLGALFAIILAGVEAGAQFIYFQF